MIQKFASGRRCDDLFLGIERHPASDPAWIGWVETRKGRRGHVPARERRRSSDVRSVKAGANHTDDMTSLVENRPAAHPLRPVGLDAEHRPWPAAGTVRRLNLHDRRLRAVEILTHRAVVTLVILVDVELGKAEGHHPLSDLGVPTPDVERKKRRVPVSGERAFDAQGGQLRDVSDDGRPQGRRVDRAEAEHPRKRPPTVRRESELSYAQSLELKGREPDVASQHSAAAVDRQQILDDMKGRRASAPRIDTKRRTMAVRAVVRLSWIERKQGENP